MRTWTAFVVVTALLGALVLIFAMVKYYRDVVAYVRGDVPPSLRPMGAYIAWNAVAGGLAVAGASMTSANIFWMIGIPVVTAIAGALVAIYCLVFGRFVFPGPGYRWAIRRQRGNRSGLAGDLGRENADDGE